MLSKETIERVISEHKRGDRDTGSTEVQVALLTERINHLTGHFTKNKHDYHGQRGLLKLVGQRRSLLRYLRNKDSERYLALIQKLGLRH